MARIVVVDNDSTFVYMVEELLDDEGWEVATCLEGETAVECIKRERPELVILDIRMETSDSGWVVLADLRSDPTTRDIQVLICSAAVDDLRTRQEWLQDAGVSVLPKPFDIDDLLQQVRRLLGESSVRHAGGSQASVSPMGE
jgi:CheY-like chemotaxis protein